MDFTLGKQPHVFDERTILVSRFMDSSFHAPTKYDFDRGRTEIPLLSGNMDLKCDVVASQANQLLRLGRIDQKRTLDITDENVTTRYKKLSKNNSGLVVLEAMWKWRRDGWKIGDKDYKISFFGEIEPNEHELMRTAVYLFHGVHIGLMLPRAVVKQMSWDYQGENGSNWKPGEMGVLAYCKAYDQHSYELILWGRRIRATNKFVEKYSDECWISMEVLDYWSTQALRLEDMFRAYPKLAIDVSSARAEARGGDKE